MTSNFQPISNLRSYKNAYSNFRNDQVVFTYLKDDDLGSFKRKNQNKFERIPENEVVNKNISYFSQVEEAILQSNSPISLNEDEQITINGQTGIWANKQESIGWNGSTPIHEYLINEDKNPEIIRKKTQHELEYVQDVAIRYLRPHTPEDYGEIIIKEEPSVYTPPAPPLVIRQVPPRPITPEPLVFREAPPPLPPKLERKVITIPGKKLPPPPRKVVVERFAPVPPKPQSVLIERWLPYKQPKRRVIFKPAPPDPVIPKPKNVIVQWDAPKVILKKEVKYLGVVSADPAKYIEKFGSKLIKPNEIPDYLREIPTPEGLASPNESTQTFLPELEGDLEALNLIDLEKEGLGDYKEYLERIGVLSDVRTPMSYAFSANLQDHSTMLLY